MDKKDIILYFSPHQDDELLTMGADICNSCLQNKEVHVILCTDGSKSPARQRLNNGESCSLHKEIHNYNLSEQEFINARDLEFISSCKALGVFTENIHIHEKRAIDGCLSVEYAQEIIKHFISIYGNNVEVCTIAPFNLGNYQHEDHRNLGLAAQNLLKQKLFYKIKFFKEPYHVPKKILKKIFFNIVYNIKEKLYSSKEIKDRTQKAMNSYLYWNPSENRFAVGYHCVQYLFEYYKNNIEIITISQRITK